MTENAKRIKDKLDQIVVNREELNQIVKDRLDFGFDSIYFRYSEAIEELGYLKEREARLDGKYFDKKHFCNTKKMHFYNVLEQLLQAHQKEDINDFNC